MTKANSLSSLENFRRDEPRKTEPLSDTNGSNAVLGPHNLDTYKASEKPLDHVTSAAISKLELPSRASFKPGMEDQLSYFIGSNVLDTHVRMYAEIEAESMETIAILHRDEKNVIQAYFDPRPSSSSWYFSKESLEEIIVTATQELEQFPDLKEPKEE